MWTFRQQSGILAWVGSGKEPVDSSSYLQSELNRHPAHLGILNAWKQSTVGRAQLTVSDKLALNVYVYFSSKYLMQRVNNS